jgi:hypothetical protein
MEAVTGNEPNEEQWQDMLFTWSDVIAKGGAALGIGAGQMSRVDSVRLAVEKCGEARGIDADSLLASPSPTARAGHPGRCHLGDPTRRIQICSELRACPG